MQSCTVIETEIGILRGRDCVYLDHTSIPDAGTLVLRGTINSRIVRNFMAPPGWEIAEELPFQLAFQNVLGFQMLEIDTWESQNEDLEALSESCFEEVIGSTWLKRLKGKRTDRQRHFRFATYDDIFDVLSSSYTLLFGERAG